MDEATRRRAIAAMRMIEEDVELDTQRREGLPFNGQTMAAALGEMCAQIGTTAKAVRLLLEELTLLDDGGAA